MHTSSTARLRAGYSSPVASTGRTVGAFGA